MPDASTTSDFLSRGGAWVVAQSILMLAVIVCGVVFHGNWSRLGLSATGAALFITGGYFGIAGVMVLGRNRTPYPRPMEDSELVQHGIYAQVRHPLYTGAILASLGWALIWQSAPALVPAILLIPFFHSKARCEERWLRAEFPAYSDYERRVPRFVPRVWRRRASI